MTKNETLQFVLDALLRFGDLPAVIAVRGGEAETWSYAQIEEEARRIASGLAARGVSRGEPIGLCGSNCPRWIVARLALIVLGAKAVHIDPELEEASLTHIVEDSGLARAFVDAELAPKLASAACGNRIETFTLDETSVGSTREATLRLDELRAHPLAVVPSVAPDDVAALFYTSGTTGTPKGVPLTHANIMANLQALLALEVLGTDDRVMLPLPLHHAYPFIVGMLTPLSSGSAIVLPEAVSGPRIMEANLQTKATVMIGVPRLYSAMVAGVETRITEGGRFAERIFRLLLYASTVGQRFGWSLGRLFFARLHDVFGSELKVLVSGGARLEEPLERTLLALGWRVLNGWGLVETASVATFNPPKRSRIGTVGIPVPGLDLRIDHADETGLGEVVLRGPSVFAGYFRDPLADRAAFTHDGWFRTGDLGRIDEDGYLSILGRIKEIIVLADGKNIAPEEVERAYGESPFVREIAVLERAGGLVAIVIPNLEAARAAGTARIDQMLRVSIGEISQSLPSFKRISGFALAHEPLPRTRLGKYRRHLMPEIYEQSLTGRAKSAAQLSPEDKALLSQPRMGAVWRWLEQRFPDHVLSPDTSPQLDLGVDSLGWIELSAELGTSFDIHLPDEAIDRIVTLRDLLRAVEIGESSEAPSTNVATPTQESERWLAPTGPALRILGFAIYAIAWLGCRLYFRLVVEGRGVLPEDGPFILAANHCSDIDPVVLAAALPWRHARDTYWSGDSTRLFGTRLRRLFARAAQIFPVDDRVPVTSLAYGAEVLSRVQILAWFPEEWRSPDGQLQPFLPGIGALVETTGALVVPIHIDGTFAAMPRSAHWPRPRQVRLRFGSPLESNVLLRSFSGSDRRKGIAAAIRDAVADLGNEGNPTGQIRST